MLVTIFWKILYLPKLKDSKMEYFVTKCSQKLLKSLKHFETFCHMDVTFTRNTPKHVFFYVLHFGIFLEHAGSKLSNVISGNNATVVFPAFG